MRDNRSNQVASLRTFKSQLFKTLQVSSTYIEVTYENNWRIIGKTEHLYRFVHGRPVHTQRTAKSSYRKLEVERALLDQGRLDSLLLITQGNTRLLRIFTSVALLCFACLIFNDGVAQHACMHGPIYIHTCPDTVCVHDPRRPIYIRPYGQPGRLAC